MAKSKNLPVKTADAKPKKPPGRPRKELDWQLIEKMAEEQCTADQIAACMDCERSLIYDRYSHVLQKGKDKGRRRLIAAMWEKALVAKDTKMQIWLSKQYLGYKDNYAQEAPNISFNVTIQEVPK